MAEEKEGYRLVYSSREPGAALDLLESEHKVSEFVDGFGNVGFGSAIARIQLFHVARVVPDETVGAIETRLCDKELIVPTAALYEFAANIVLSFATNRGALQKQAEFVEGRLDEALKKLRDIG